MELKFNLKNKIEETVFNFTDLINLIKNFQEIEILKSMFIDPKKKIIFNSLFNNAFNNKIGISLIQILLSNNNIDSDELKLSNS